MVATSWSLGIIVGYLFGDNQLDKDSEKLSSDFIARWTGH
jgi:hypothetical protein